MAKPTKRDLFATLEDDLKQFRDALFGVLRAALGAIAKRVGQITQAITGPVSIGKEAKEKD
jgi:hypothetical protein